MRLNFRSIIYIFLAVFVSQSIAQTKSIIPQNVKTKIIIYSGGKSKIYYPVPSNKTAVLSLKGPGVLRVITRARIAEDNNKNLIYSLSYSVDGVKQEDVEFRNVKKSTGAVYKNKSRGIPGKKNEFSIQLGLGFHNIEIKMNDSLLKIDARYRFTRRKIKKQKWIQLTPLPPCEPVDLVTREILSHYYRFSQQSELKFKIIGPTLVRILTRAEFEYDMKGRVNYRIQVKEDENIVNTFLLSSVRSEITGYKNDGRMVPGKACEIVLNVPSGAHRFKIYPLDKDKNTILGKILFPRQDVKLEE